MRCPLFIVEAMCDLWLAHPGPCVATKRDGRWYFAAGDPVLATHQHDGEGLAAIAKDESELANEWQRRCIEAEHKLTAIRTILENYDPYETDYAFHVVRAIEELKP